MAEETFLEKTETQMNKVLITKWTANIILLIMVLVWAVISLNKMRIEPISASFITLGGLLAFGDVAGSIVNKFQFPKQ